MELGVLSRNVGNILRANYYKVKRAEYYLVPYECASFSTRKPFEAYESVDEEGENEIRPPERAHILPVLTTPLVSPPLYETQDCTSDVSILLGLPETPPGPGSITVQPQTSSEDAHAWEIWWDFSFRVGYCIFKICDLLTFLMIVCCLGIDYDINLNSEGYSRWETFNLSVLKTVFF